MQTVKPKTLKPGDTIGVIAPSSWTDPPFIEAAAEKLRGFGYNVVLHPQCYERERGAAGTTTQKIAAIHDVFSDASIDAVFVARGGSRALHTLDGIDYDLIRRNPKIFMGFSDVTTLLSAFYTRAGLIGFHGVTEASFHPTRNPVSAQPTISFLSGEWNRPLWPDYPVETFKSGTAEGILFGGNLCLLTALLASGDRYVPDLSGKLLVIEDVGEEIRSLDRMLGALRLRGALRQIAGLIVGQMTDVKDTNEYGALFDRTIQEVVREHTADMKAPVVFNAPIGHEHPNIPFPVGIKARLSAPETGQPQLQLLESPFADA